MGIVLAPLAFEQANAQTVGLKEGQWVKYIPNCIAAVHISDNELKMEKKDIMEKHCSNSMKERFGVTDVNDIEWYKVKVSKVDGTEVTFDESIKVKGSAEKSMGVPLTIPLGSNWSFEEMLAIHVGLGIGDQIPLPLNYSPLEVYEISNMSEDVLWKHSGFENVEFLYLTSTKTEYNEDRNEVYLDADFWFERSTGILLENVISISIYYDGYEEWIKLSEELVLLDFSIEGIKVQEKTDFDSLSFEEAETKIANLEGTGRYIINKVCCDNMGDDNIVNKYEILTANHEEIGMLQIEGKDKVGVIGAISYFRPSSMTQNFSQEGPTRDDANDIMLEIQKRFVPEDRAISPSMIWMKHQDEKYTETKKVGSRTIKLDSIPTTTLGTPWVGFRLMIDYGMIGSVFQQQVIEPPSKILMPESSEKIQEKLARLEGERTQSDLMVVGLTFFVIGIPVIIIAAVIILIKKRKGERATKITQQEPSSAIQQQIEQDQTLRYDSSLRKRTNLWYLVPSLAGVIGGIIAYFILRKDDPKKAKNCLYLSVAVTAIGIIINLVI